MSLAQVKSRSANISVDVKVTSTVGNASTTSIVTPKVDSEGNVGVNANANGDATASVPAIAKEVAPHVTPVVETIKDTATNVVNGARGIFGAQANTTANSTITK